jgi:manganese-transporting P-type ATPase C
MGGSHLETAGRVDAVVFVKTGPLTIGRPVLTNVVSFDPAWAPKQVLAYAASSDIHFRHPLAQAVIRLTVERHIEIPPHEKCEALLGLGTRTQADVRTLLLGSLKLLDAGQVAVSGEARDSIAWLRDSAETPLLLAVNGTLTGLVSPQDTLRPEARQVTDGLRADGYTASSC